MTSEWDRFKICGVLRNWIEGSRRDPATWLISKEYILQPPFKVKCDYKNGYYDVEITGENTTFSYRFTELVVSKFRNQIGLFLIENGTLVDSQVVVPLNKAYQEILTSFPPSSVFNSQQLYNAVVKADGSPQAHARRRWKELKYDYGFDVDFDGSNYWRGPSTAPIRNPQIRPDDKEIRKEYWNLLAQQSMQDNNDVIAHCEYCDARVASREEIDRGLETSYDDIGLIDHRRPVFQGGDDSVQNFQIFCQTCNNRKNSCCRKCPFNYKCDTCVWAFPNTSKAKRIVLWIDPNIYPKLVRKFGGADLEIRLSTYLSSIVVND